MKRVLSQMQARRISAAIAGRLRARSRGIVTKDSDKEVRNRIALVFESFRSLRTAAQVKRAFCVRILSLPRRDPHGGVYWKRPSVPAVTDILKNPAHAGAFVYGRKQLRPASQAAGRLGEASFAAMAG